MNLFTVVLRAAVAAGVRCAGVATLLATAPAIACDPPLRGAGVARIEGRQIVVAWRAVPAPIRPSEFFALEVAVCARNGVAASPALRVDARMPEHNHGMNYRPRVIPQGNGRFDVTGLLLHMHGRWQLSFDVRAADVAETLRTDILLN